RIEQRHESMDDSYLVCAVSEGQVPLGKVNVVVESWGRKQSEAKNAFWIAFLTIQAYDRERMLVVLDKMSQSKERHQPKMTLPIEEAYTTKYSIHPGADTMLCGFRLTNRWLSMKKDIASC
ncbi:hypothetical protein Tco_1027293, partial [Tanacetum coccineum]